MAGDAARRTFRVDRHNGSGSAAVLGGVGGSVVAGAATVAPEFAGFDDFYRHEHPRVLASDIDPACGDDLIRPGDVVEAAIESQESTLRAGKGISCGSSG